MGQLTLASQGSFEQYGKKTRREKFLEEMDGIVPWSELESLIAPHYPKDGNGRPAVGLRIMLRIYFLRYWFNLSDPAAEEALYDSPALRRFAGVDLGRAAAPDETTILNFRHLLQAIDELQRRKNRTKAKIRAKVEHPFRILKRVFGFVKVRFRGLKKNHDHLCTAFALVNLYMHRKRLAPLGA